MIGPTDRPWQRYTLCSITPELPWTRDEADLTTDDADRIRAVCAQCPVRLACRAYADANNMTGGWWAGEDRDPDSPTNQARREPDWLPVKGARGRELPEQQAALSLTLFGGAA
jgi:hypothetical protein